MKAGFQALVSPTVMHLISIVFRVWRGNNNRRLCIVVACLRERYCASDVGKGI